MSHIESHHHPCHPLLPCVFLADDSLCVMMEVSGIFWHLHTIMALSLVIQYGTLLSTSSRATSQLPPVLFPISLGRLKLVDRTVQVILLSVSPQIEVGEDGNQVKNETEMSSRQSRLTTNTDLLTSHTCDLLTLIC